MTVSEFIASALRRINVLRRGQAPTADQVAQGIQILNEMMARLVADGFDIGYSPVVSGAQDVGIEDWAMEAIRSNLAVSMAPDFDAPLDPRLLQIAADSLLSVKRNTIKVPETVTNLPLGSHRWHFEDL
jgi:hypothetical protein